MARQGQLARRLARLLRRREVICAPSDTPGLQGCRIGNYNLSAIILAAGGGRATPNASEELQAAEDQARSARLGGGGEGDKADARKVILSASRECPSLTELLAGSGVGLLLC
jgi:hypothetical protein